MCFIDTHPRIDTERLVLRAPRMRDAERIAELANDVDIARMTTLPHPYAVSDACDFIGGLEAQDRSRAATFAIEHRQDGLIGMIGFELRSGWGPEIGYWIGRPYWGQGIASEASRAALGWAERDWRKRVVTAGHFADNPASGRVLVKAGFLYTGEVRPRRSAARTETTPMRMMVWLA